MSQEPNPETAELMTRFLLDQLSEEERKTVEERFLSDDQYFEQLLVMEDSLVDDYVLGQLNEEDRKNAELLFQSSPVGRKEVKFTEDLVANLKRKREAKTEGKRKNKRAIVTNEIIAPKTSGSFGSQASWSLIAAGLKGLPRGLSAAAGLVLLLLASTLIYFIYNYQRQRRELLAQQTALQQSVQETRHKLDQEIQNSSELGKRLDRETELRVQAEEALAQARAPEPRSIISLVLLPTFFERGAGSKTVTLKAEANRLQLLLEVPSDRSYPKYNVVIKTFEGRQVFSRDSISATQLKQNKLPLLLSSSLFPYNDYRIELHGVSRTGESQLVADYSFKVRK